MPVKRRLPKTRILSDAESVAPDLGEWFLGEFDEPPWDVLLVHPTELKAAWRACAEELVRDWVRDHPGTRPLGWWAYDAPSPRLRVGGTGDPDDASVYFLTKTGLPSSWIAFDPLDPPRFEAQAVFLDRRGMLSPAERRRLIPADFKPEVVASSNPRQTGDP